jgi:hypothetical protein
VPVTGAPERLAAELAELARLAPERPAWSLEWREARAWFAAQARDAGLDFEADHAGNHWYTSGGRREAAIVIGGHLDTPLDAGPTAVPGAALETISSDGAVSLLVGLALLRQLKASPTPVPAVRLVDWADGVGARFGRPFGASAASGRLNDWYRAQELLDASGVSLREATQACGVQAKLAPTARRSLVGTRAYLEIAAGSEPREADSPLLSVASGALGLERCQLIWRRAENVLPVDQARSLMCTAERFTDELTGPSADPSVAAASRIVATHAFGGEGAVSQVLDQYHSSPTLLEAQLETALTISDRVASEDEATVEWRHLWRTTPVVFDAGLTALAAETLSNGLTQPQLSTATAQCAATELARSGIPASLLLLGPEPDRSRPGAAAFALDVLESLVARLG